MVPKVQMRVVTYRGRTFIDSEDVVRYIRAIASGEETDVRVRLNQGADNIEVRL